MYQSQCGRNRPARPSYERASLFNQYRAQQQFDTCPVIRLIGTCRQVRGLRLWNVPQRVHVKPSRDHSEKLI